MNLSALNKPLGALTLTLHFTDGEMRHRVKSLAQGHTASKWNCGGHRYAHFLKAIFVFIVLIYVSNLERQMVPVDLT